MSNLLWLDEIGPADAARVGGKALRCAEMRQAGVPVPDAVVVTAEAAQSESILAELQRCLRRWPADTRFAVRSSALDEDSAQRSFAGMHETRLNVTLAEAAGAVRACWESVNSERARAYREAQGVTADQILTAVMVQLMVPATSAGVVFTRNPVNGDDEVVINAGAGLGEALVSGMVDPDEWRLRKPDLTVLSHRPGSGAAQSSLSDAQVKELGVLSLRIERLFGTPQDIEWCHDGRRFWIVQARPVTTVPRQNEVEWSRANVREVLPDLPSPQVVDFVCHVINVGQRAYGGRLWAPEAELGPLMKVFNGRPYFNITQFRHICSVLGVAPAEVLKSVGYDELRPEDELVSPRPWKLYLRALPDILRTLSYQLRLGPLMRKYLRMLDEEVVIARRALASGLDVQAMWATMKLRRRQAPRQLLPVFALSAVANFEEQVRKILRRIPFPYEELVPPALAAGEKSVSAQQAFDLLRLAALARADAHVSGYFVETAAFQGYRNVLADTEFLRQFDGFLAKYGHRGHYETDWSLPRYAEDPAPLLAAIGLHVQSPSFRSAEDILARQEREARDAWARFDEALSGWQRLILRPIVRFLLRRIKQMYLWRELYRSELTRVAMAIREWHFVVAQKLIASGCLAERDDYFLLTYTELGAAIEGRASAAELKELLARRKAELEAWSMLDMPLSLRESELSRIRPRRTAPSEGSAVRELRGLCVSRGRAEAEVVVLHSPADFARMKRGAIIVAPATDPSWTPLFTLASGLIVEIGGTLSHAAIVAREYGLPALANVPHATQLLHDGDRVSLDAAAGCARVLGERVRARLQSCR